MFERFAEGKKKLEARLGIEQKAVLQIGLANVGLLILRIFGEEKLLARDLEGYCSGILSRRCVTTWYHACW